MSTVVFSVISSDSSLLSALTTGAIQGPEWTFTVGSYTSMATTSSVAEGSTSTYEFDGIAFNTVRPYINNVDFRQAMAYLTSYSYIQTTVLSSIGGTASINFLPCTIYPGACYSGADQYSANMGQTDLQDAYTLLVKAGLHPGNTTDVTNLAGIPDWYAGPTDNAIISNITPACSSTNDSSVCLFRPLFYYRSDDPLRTELATGLCATALDIGLHLNCEGITGSAADADVYGESGEAVITPGLYNATSGYNRAPVFNSTIVNGTRTVSSADNWDMYTFGWITSADYTWTWYFFNSQGIGEDNFVNYYNPTIDYQTNALYYASTISAAETAAKALAIDLQVQLPYLMGFYENQLYAVYTNGWTGYANEPSTGPDTGTGLFYTLLNVHPTTSAMGGTFDLALHEIADQSGMNPLYLTEWVWQEDIWGQIYDSPLAAPPTALTTVNDYINWMTVAPGNGTTLYNNLVNPFTGTTQTGAGWSNAWQPDSTNTPHKIVNGQAITLTFRNNITWTDNVPLTAYDFNFSLWAWDVTGNSGSITPLAYEMYGSSGLIATYINPSNPYQITMYVNSSSIWNLGEVIVPVVPMHILDNFNLADLAGETGAVDLTQPSTSTATGAASSSFCGSGCLRSDPIWMQYLPNLEVGSGPFYMYTYAGVTSGAGELKANPNYDRTAWNVIAAQPANTISTTATTYPFSTTIQEFTYNPTGSTVTFGGDYGSLTSHSTGYIDITNATVSIQLYSSNGTKVGSAITTGITQTNGNYTASIGTSALAPGAYEIVITANYNFLGLARTWYQASGFTKQSPAVTTTTAPTTTTVPITTTSTSTSKTTSTHTTTTSTSTSTSTATATIIAVIIIVIIVVLIVAYLLRRRTKQNLRPKPKA